MEEIYSSEASVDFHWTKRRFIPEDRPLHSITNLLSPSLFQVVLFTLEQYVSVSKSGICTQYSSAICYQNVCCRNVCHIEMKEEHRRRTQIRILVERKIKTVEKLTENLQEFARQLCN
jgi:hypothetical protein